MPVVADTTKVRIFKQITTIILMLVLEILLLLIPQRYEFSSKSQRTRESCYQIASCCWYHKGTNFQANHNMLSSLSVCHSLLLIPQRYEFSSKSQLVLIFSLHLRVVADTTKVRIFKQITTYCVRLNARGRLLLIPQRYEFSSKSQRLLAWCYKIRVVADTTKVRIFKQITTARARILLIAKLLLIPQRYEFSSKSQLVFESRSELDSCCWYHKGTNFQANHNNSGQPYVWASVVADTTKVRIFKQITTAFRSTCLIQSCCWYHKGTNFQANHNPYVWASNGLVLLLIPQRYEFSSKSQHKNTYKDEPVCCCWYHKGTNFQANYNR